MRSFWSVLRRCVEVVAVAALLGGTLLAPSAQALVLPVPSAPTNAHITQRGTSNVDMTWQAPTRNLAQVTGYEIQYSTNSTSWTSVSPILAANATSASVTGLTPGSSYYFRISAIGGGAQSAWTVFADTLTDYVSVVSGGNHTCAITSEGAVECWGANDQGQLGDGTLINRTLPVRVAGLSSVSAITAGAAHTCALLSDGSVRCWGDNVSGQLGNGTTTDSRTPVAVTGLGQAVEISAGGQSTCARLNSGEVQCWGLNSSGQLGNGTLINSSTPTAVLEILDAVELSVGAAFACAVLSTGGAACWGSGGSGQLGDGLQSDSSSPVNVVIDVLEGVNVVQVSAGDSFACAAMSDGTVQCWGLNASGQLGRGNTTIGLTAAPMTGITTAVSVTAGGSHVCVTLSNFSIRCAGLNSSGQLGDGTTTNRTTSVVSIAGATVSSVSAGGSHTCAVVAGNDIRCWGLNASGQVGDGTRINRTAATLVLPQVTVIKSATGTDHSCFLTSDGRVRCVGGNFNNQLGDGTALDRNFVTNVGTITNAVDIAAGDNHTCVVLATGTVQCWGLNSTGQLGNNTTTNSSTPVNVTGITTAVAVSAGETSTCALLADSSIRCWGGNAFGQLGNNTLTNSLTPVVVSGITNANEVSVGFSHACAVLETGAVKCWGANGFGQLGNATIEDSAIPVDVTGVTSAISISLGINHSCALLSGGAVNCWGSNFDGQLGNSSTTDESTPVSVTGLTNASSVDAGGSHTCAVLTTGQIQCWGYGFFGQLGRGSSASSSTPVAVSNIVAAISVSAGSEHTCAVMADGLASCWGENGTTQLGANSTLAFSSLPVAVLGFASAFVGPATLPDPPTSVTGVPANGQVTVSWLAGSSNGRAISSYTVYASPGSASCTTSGLSCTVTGLTNGNSYTFRVTATNAIGTSGLSAPTDSITPSSAPNAPTGVTAVRGVASASVTWTAATVDGSPVTGYVVTANPGGQTCSTASTTCTVTGLSNGTSYTFTVRAQNAVGFSIPSAPSAAVVVGALPSAPTTVNATRGNTQVSVAWNAGNGNGVAITGYAVTANPGGQTCTTTGALTCTVTGLTNGTSYTFSVVTITVVGESSIPAVSASVTPAGPPLAPTGVVGTASNGQVVVGWNAADGNGSAVSGYTVNATPGTANCSTSVANNPDPLTCTITGLTNGVLYTFSVRAINALGTSAAGTATATPSSVPNAPTNVVATRGDQQVTVSWTAANAQGSPITGYTVTSSPGSFTCTTATTSCIVTGLTNGTAYTFTVVATNANGNSVASAASTAVTPAAPPSAPSTVTATAGNAQATVSWLAPLSDGGVAVTSYTVTASPGGRTCSVAAPTLTCNVTLLTNGTEYTFTVVAISAAGTSAASSASNAVTPVGPPGAPTAVTAVGGNTQATVSWTAPANLNGSTSISYTVTSTPGSFTCTTSTTSCVVTGLSNGTTYTFRVVTTGSGGTSALSAASNAVLAGIVPDTPGNVTATRGNARVTVAWTISNGNGNAVVGYRATASPGGLFCQTTTALTCDVTGLTNGTAYTFTVVATNAVGDSIASTPTAAVTPAAPPSAPTGATAVGGNTQATVSWSASTASNGAVISGYTVTARINGVAQAQTCSTLVTDATPLTCTVTGLTNGVTYTFVVVANSDAGSSIASVASNAVLAGIVPTTPGSVTATRGNARVTVAWTASNGNGNTVTSYRATATPGGFFCQTTTALTCDVTGLTNGTSYTFTVVATNAVGDSIASAPTSAVSPAAPPSAPTAVLAQGGDGQATVSWTAPATLNGAVITGYTVTARINGVAQAQTCSTLFTDQTPTSCVVTGLTNGVTYTFVVVASSDAGVSVASLPSANVLAGIVPSTPGSVTATRGNARVTVAWTASNGNGNTVTSYRATATPGGFFCQTTTALTCDVTGLTNGTSYTFTVVAANAVGNSIASDPTAAVSPAAPPSSPTAVTAQGGNTQATVSWTAPTTLNGAVITGYTATARINGVAQAQTCSTLITDATPLSCVVTGLTNGITYTFVVTAASDAGASLASAPSTAVLAGIVPDTPSNVTATRGNARVTVAWTASNGNGNNVTGYRVTSTPGSFICTTTTATTCDVVGLTNGTSYTFTVVATNAVGNSEASSPTTAVSPAAPPSAPTAVTAQGGNTQATISWTAPATLNGSVITGYTVTARVNGAASGQTCSTLFTDANPLSCVVIGLTNGITYTFVVTAASDAGASVASAPSNAVLAGIVPDAPTGATATRAGSGAVTVTWTGSNGNGNPVTGYRVTSTPGSFICTTTTATTCNVVGLTNGTSYTFSVVAINAVGNSAASTATSAVTPAGAPTAPTAVSATRGNTEAVVSWTAPASLNGSVLSGYTVTSNPGGLTCTTSSTSCTVTGLTNGTSYTFTVVAGSDAGNSAPSTASTAVVVGVIPTVPTNVTAIRGAAAASVSWTASDGAGATITSYRVTSNPGGFFCTTATTTCEVTGLTNGTSYTFTVTATSAVGTSAASDASNAVVPAAVTNPPTAVLATRGDTQATISWTAPTVLNGAILTGYTATARIAGVAQAQTCSTLITDATPLECTITGLTNGTSYTFTVVAISNAGNSAPSTASAALVVGVVPTAPSTVTATRGNLQATVSWSGANLFGAPITSYTVTANPGAQTCTTSTASCTVTGLTNGTSYTFTVTATTAVGTSSASTASNAVIPAGAPTAPTNVSAVRGNASAVVTWTASTGNGVEITGYVVTARINGVNQAQTCSTTVGIDLSPTTCTVSGLTNGTAYTFAVVATNAVPLSSTAGISNAITPATVPNAPTNINAVRGDTSVAVSWTAPAVNGGSAVTGYTVTANPGGLTCTTAQTTCSVLGLSNGTSYTFSVVATNAVGSSVASADSLAVTPAGAPTVPLNVVATRGNGSATITWDAPASTNGAAIIGYIVVSTPGNFGCPASLNTSCTVTGLTNGTSYVFSVIADNGVNVSSADSNPVTPAAAPAAPINVTGTAGNGAVTVSWTAGSSNGDPITSFLVTSNPGGATCTATTATTCTINGLSNGTAYTFVVTATNGLGTSPQSVQSAPVTPFSAPAPPTGVSATRGDGRATVSWIAPTDNGGAAITGYTARAFLATDSSLQTVLATCSVNALTCEITGLTNGVSYVFNVIATTSRGNSLASAVSSALVPAGRPFAPYQVSVTPGNGSLQVSWFAGGDNGEAITSFRATTNIGNVSCTATAPATSCTIVGLANGTAYQVSVVALSAAGTSDASALSAEATPAAAPSAPRSVTATRAAASAVVEWLAPTTNNGATITRYIVTSSGGQTCETTGALTCTVTGLTNGVSYTFTVVARNSAGTSVASDASNAVTPAAAPDAPTSVSAVRGDGQVTLSWIAGASNGSSITSFTAMWTFGANQSGQQVCALSPCLITGLTNGTAYIFRVKAINAIGMSADSSVSSSVTPAGAPTAPTSVSASRIDGGARVTWSGANANGAAITYSVISDPGSFSCSTTSTSCDITGLSAGTSYTFTVTSTNVVSSSSGAASNAMLYAAAPNAPSSVVAVAGDKVALITWTASTSSNGSAITGYRVTASPGGATCDTDSETTACTVNGLTNGTTYTFNVVALNAIGSSNAAVSLGAKPAGLPGAVAAITATAPAAKTVKLTWLAANMNGGKLSTYEYSFKLQAARSYSSWKKAGTSRALTLKNLVKGKVYQIKIRTVTDKGQRISKVFTFKATK